MLGLIYFLAALIYLTIMFLAVRGAWRIGRKGNGSVWRGVGFAVGGFLLVYLPVFWSQIPTTLSFKNACERDAGYQELVSPKEWRARHPGIDDRLKGIDLTKSTKVPGTNEGFSRRIDFGGSRAWDQQISTTDTWGVEITRTETRIVDLVDGAVLAKSIDYATGSPDDAFFWRTRASCFSQFESPLARLVEYSYEMMGVKK